MSWKLCTDFCTENGRLRGLRLLLASAATNDRGPKLMEKALAAIHQALPEEGRRYIFSRTWMASRHALQIVILPNPSPVHYSENGIRVFAEPQRSRARAYRSSPCIEVMPSR